MNKKIAVITGGSRGLGKNASSYNFVECMLYEVITHAHENHPLFFDRLPSLVRCGVYVAALPALSARYHPITTGASQRARVAALAVCRSFPGVYRTAGDCSFPGYHHP